MSVDEKISLIEDCMDLEEGTLSLKDNMEDYEEWDSLTALSIISAVSEKYHKTITGEDLKKVKIVSDVVELFD